MQLNSASLPKRLAQCEKAGEFPPLWVIADSEPLLALEAADAVRAAARRAGCAEREVLALSPVSDWSRIGEATSGMSLFAEKKVLEVRLQSPAPGVKGTAALSSLGSAALEGVCVIVTIPGADWKVRKAKWFAELTKNAETVICDPVPRESLPAWLKKRLAAEGLAIEEDALEFLASQTEGNLLSAHQEVRKLALLHEGEAPLALAEVQRSVLDNSRYDIGAISEAAMRGDAERACRAIDGIKAELDLSQAMPLLLYTFSEDIRKMMALRARTDAGERPEAAARALRIFPFEKVPAVIAGARRLSAKKLRAALSVCADIDRLYKGLPVKDRDTDPWIELKSVASFIAR